jgi:hypothetical protein
MEGPPIDAFVRHRDEDVLNLVAVDDNRTVKRPLRSVLFEEQDGVVAGPKRRGTIQRNLLQRRTDPLPGQDTSLVLPLQCQAKHDGSHNK